MNSADLHRLLRYVADNRLKESYEIVQSMTMQERDVLAKAFIEGANFLLKVNEDWKGAMHFDTNREE